MYRDCRMSDYEMNEFGSSIADENLEALEIQGYDVLSFISWLRNSRFLYEFLNRHELTESEIHELFQEYVECCIDDLLDANGDYDPAKLAQIPFSIVLVDENGKEFTT